jgi:RNA-directed DNA polymerase
MSQLLALRKSTSLSELASLLDIKPAMLSYQLYKIPVENRYSKFEIPKKHGGIREICAPAKNLKLIQYRLSQLLQNCAEEIRASHNHAESKEHYGIAHGFKRNHSILTNAQMHKTKRFVFNVDLKDFFGSINFGRVRGFFIKDKNFALHPNVATVLAQIACHENKLPQGSPCSPTISNLIGHVLDILLVRLAAKTGCTYTRYADDLTFSSNKRLFPSSVAKQTLVDGHIWTAGSELNRLVLKSGFSFNESKTRMQYRDSRQEVTGLTVNGKINSAKDYRYTVRAMVHSLINKGSFEYFVTIKDTEGVVTVKKELGNSEELLGMLAFIDQVDQYNVQMYKGEHPTPPPSASREKLYRQFILFDSFYSTKLPAIICEGDTDNVYLAHAIHQLVSTYPQLAIKEPSGKFKLNIRLHKYSNKATSRILKMHGGTGQLASFITEYCRQITGFKAPGAIHPVIVLIDNDKGKSNVTSAVEKITGKTISGSELFIHVCRNLYVVLTPIIAPAIESCIENCFDNATLGNIHQGKKFNGAKKIDPSTEYGKVVFAHEVVRPNASKINFDGFRPLLDRIQMVIDEQARSASKSS